LIKENGCPQFKFTMFLLNDATKANGSAMSNQKKETPLWLVNAVQIVIGDFADL